MVLASQFDDEQVSHRLLFNNSYQQENNESVSSTIADSLYCQAWALLLASRRRA